MLLPSMTVEEIRKEFEKDYEIFVRKIGYVAIDLEKRLSNYEKKQGYQYFFNYLSKYKNKWICKIFLKKIDYSYTSMLIYHNGKGHVALTILHTGNIVYHTGHFFERYNERCNLGINNFDDIVKHYMVNIGGYRFEKLNEISPGIYKMFCTIPTGIALGMYNSKHNLIKANTFIPNNMLNQNQADFKAELNSRLEKYKHTSYILD